MSIRRAGRALLRIIGEWNIGGLSPREPFKIPNVDLTSALATPGESGLSLVTGNTSLSRAVMIREAAAAGDEDAQKTLERWRKNWNTPLSEARFDIAAPHANRAVLPLYLTDGRVYLREGEAVGTAELLFVSDDGQSRAMPLPPATVSRWLEKLAAINARRG